MADLLCDMDCIHRSRRPLRKWKSFDGSPCYGCTLNYVKISGGMDSEESKAHCMFYIPAGQASSKLKCRLPGEAE